MRIDAAERFAFLFIYGKAQFRTKTQCTFGTKKVDSSLLVFKIAHARLTCLCFIISQRKPVFMMLIVIDQIRFLSNILNATRKCINKKSLCNKKIPTIIFIF